MKTLRTLSLLLVALAAIASLPAFAADGARKVKDQVQPVYPELAKSMNISGAVRLELTVTAQGAVKNAKVLGGHPMLADAAVRAATRWKYEPGPEETISVTIEFKR
jgi:TonB family protein